MPERGDPRRTRSEAAWLPPILDRCGYAEPDWENAVLDKFQQKVDGLIASYRKPEGREDQLAKMPEVVERARQELLP